jgi:enoyl-CoA hydratase
VGLAVDTRDHVVDVALDFPPVNALTSADFLALADTVEAAGRDPQTRVVLIRSAVERGFCAGVDVKEMTEGGNRALVAVNRATARCYEAIYRCEVPVVVAVHGFCLATGIGIVGNADVALASDDATFGLPEVDRGGLGSSTQLQRLLPGHRARYLAYSCERATAAELLRAGSLEQVVPRAELSDAANAICATLAAKSPIVLRRAKESLNAIDPVDVVRSFRQEQGFTFELNLDDTPDALRASLFDRPSPAAPAPGR